jgi:hypothetical protein
MEIVENKKDKLRKKSLEHYYQNIPYYREYYVRNKEKLLKYNTDYKNRCKNIVFEKKSHQVGVQFNKGTFILEFD